LDFLVAERLEQSSAAPDAPAQRLATMTLFTGSTDSCCEAIMGTMNAIPLIVLLA
jgi:hypothetical protein